MSKNHNTGYAIQVLLNKDEEEAITIQALTSSHRSGSRKAIVIVESIMHLIESDLRLISSTHYKN